MAYNTIALNNVYNYYMTTYAPRSSSRYDTHKKSELRNIYNTIVKINKESPLQQRIQKLCCRDKGRCQRTPQCNRLFRRLGRREDFKQKSFLFQ